MPHDMLLYLSLALMLVGVAFTVKRFLVDDSSPAKTQIRAARNSRIEVAALLGAAVALAFNDSGGLGNGMAVFLFILAVSDFKTTQDLRDRAKKARADERRQAREALEQRRLQLEKEMDEADEIADLLGLPRTPRIKETPQ